MSKKRSCGSCGKSITDGNRRKGYNSLCSDCRIPHMICTNMPNGRYRCDECGYADQLNNMRLIDCGNTNFPPCKTCGGTPYCDKDCAGMAELFAHPKVYVAGFGPEQ